MIEVQDHPDELLPWYVNATLVGQELRAVEQHLGGCERCRGEVELLGILRHAIQQADDVDSRNEVGRARLMRSIRHERIRSWFKPALAIAATLVIAVQAVLLVNLVPREPAIVPLGAVSSKEAVVQLQFASAATEPEIRHVLQEAGATLVGGPGALGVYRARLDGIKPDDRARIAEVIAALRANSTVVIYAEQDR